MRSASITSMIRHYVARRAQVTEGHPHNAAERAAGQEGETELGYAALAQFCAPGLDRLVRLPAPQRDAMRVAFGRCTGDPPDQLLVALALLTLS